MSDEARHLCTECWTEGEGSAPKACPVCGTVGAWFVTATHSGRPLKEVLAGLFAGWRVPSELEDVLVKPSERPEEAQAAEDPRTDMDRVSVSLRFEDEGRDVPESDIEILARCDLLWSGWECDHTVMLYRLRSTGETGLHVVGGVTVDAQSGGLIAVLEERLEAYREAIKETEAFLERVRQDGEMEDLRDLEDATRAVKETRAEYRKRPWREDEVVQQEGTHEMKLLPSQTYEKDRFLVQSLEGDLMRWLREEGKPTEGVEVLAAVALLSAGEPPEYGVVLYRDADGTMRLWTAWQYEEPWSAEYAVEVLEHRADGYERLARQSREFVALAKESLPGQFGAPADLGRIHIAARLREQGRVVAEEDIDLLDWTFEGGIRYRLRSTGEEGLHVIDPDGGDDG